MPSDVLANLRDLGGTRTTDGLRVRGLLRSAAPAHLPPERADRLTGLIGPATYVDLRTDREVERDGGAEHLVARGWTWYRFPVQDLDPERHETPSARYLRVLPRHTACARAIAALPGEDRPVVVGCSLGKDRTGVVVAVVLTWLGVPIADVMADFELSNAALRAQRHLLPSRWQAAHTTIEPVAAADCAVVLAAAGPSSEPDRSARRTLRGRFLVTTEETRTNGARALSKSSNYPGGMP